MASRWTRSFPSRLLPDPRPLPRPRPKPPDLNFHRHNVHTVLFLHSLLVLTTIPLPINAIPCDSSTDQENKNEPNPKPPALTDPSRSFHALPSVSLFNMEQLIKDSLHTPTPLKDKAQFRCVRPEGLHLLLKPTLKPASNRTRLWKYDSELSLHASMNSAPSSLQLT
ncbi:hypothetical protein Tco_0933480 [Tanacetum coccineum]